MVASFSTARWRHTGAGGAFKPVESETGALPYPKAMPLCKQHFYLGTLRPWTVGPPAAEKGLIDHLTVLIHDVLECTLCHTHSSYFKPIQQKVKTKIFNLNYFYNEFILLLKGQTNTQSLRFHLILERYLDYRSWEKKLISEKVVYEVSTLIDVSVDLGYQMRISKTAL